MPDNTISFNSPMSLTALYAKCNSSVLNPDLKGTYARKLIHSLLAEECHKHKNRPYELPTDFCYIYCACLNLEKKSEICNRTDGPYNKVHLFFLRCSNDKRDTMTFFDINDTLAILSTSDILPDDLKKHIQDMRKLLTDLDYLDYRYPHLLATIFPHESDKSKFKGNILMSLCNSDKKAFLKNNGIDTIKAQVNTLINNPYESQKK